MLSTSATSEAAPLEMAISRPRLLALSFLFLLSGFSALTYQTAWQRLLGLFSGSDSISITIVVGAFLLGLGIGSLASTIFTDRLSPRGAIFGFALCETGIAVFALASKLFFYDLLFRATGMLATDRLTVFFVALAGLLIPTFLMGLSLPLLAKSVVHHIETAAERIGWLYALNTLGAALGAFVAGCYLIGTFGYVSTIYIAAFINLLVAGGALLLGSGVEIPSDALRARTEASPSAADTNREVLLWCVLAFVSGFIIISLEIIWFRVIGVALKSSTYTFALVLGWFLVGDAAGIFLGTAAVSRISRPRHFFLCLQGAVALYSVVALWLLALAYSIPTVHDLFWPSVSVFFDAFYDHSVPPLTIGEVMTVLGVVAFPVLPPAALLGMSVPLAQKAIHDDLAKVGRRVGFIQVANIVGNALGSFATGLLLLHYLGTAASLRLVALLGLAFTIWALVDHARTTARLRTAWSQAALAVSLMIVVLTFPGAVTFWRELHAFGRSQPVFVGEDRTGIALVQYDSPREAGLYLGGKRQSSVPFGPGHMLMGLLGTLVHPQPKSAFIIGLGTGGTAYAAGANPSIERVRVVEILAPIYAVMQRFNGLGGGTAVQRLFSDPRYRLDVGDARHVLFTEQTKYDIIQADAIFPHDAHSGLLYSVEYFQQVRTRLNPGGICAQWAPTARTVNSFVAAFPYVVKIGNYLLGSDTPIPFDINAFVRRLHEPAVQAYIAAADWKIEPIERFFVASSRHLMKWSPGDQRAADTNTDLFPKDEYYLNSSAIYR